MEDLRCLVHVELKSMVTIFPLWELVSLIWDTGRNSRALTVDFTGLTSILLDVEHPIYPTASIIIILASYVIPY